MQTPSSISVGELEVRPRERLVLVRGNEVPLTPGEFDILKMLAEHPGWVYSASQLAGDSEEGDHSPESVSVLVSRLRHRLAEAGVRDIVETVRGYGYRMHTSAELGDAMPHAAGAHRGLRDAAWRLQEAVIEVEHAGTVAQQDAATDALEAARHTIYAAMAE